MALVTAMWANNEVGTVQPVAELAAVAARHGVPLHTDAIQAVGQVPVDFAASGVVALTVTGHKLGGPVGVGALLLARDVAATPLLHGGGQERDVRSGTLDTAGIVAFAVAVESAVKGQQEYAARVGELRDELVARVQAAVPDVIYNGDPERPAARQRALLLPRLRGRRPAAAPRRPGHRLLDRLGLLGRGRPALARAAGDGRRRRPGPLLAAVHASATPRPPADVDALIAALPAAVERARRAGALRSGA